MEGYMSKRTWITLLGAICLILFLGACSPNPQPVGGTPVPSLAPGATLTLNPAIQGGVSAGSQASGPGDPAAGAAIYLQHCTPCHGTQGEGADTPIGKGPALRNNAFIASANLQAEIDTISNGRPGTLMPAWLIAQGGPLNGAQVQSAATYLLSLQNVPAIPASTPVPAEATETPAPANATAEPVEPAVPSNPGDPGQAVNLTGDAGRGKPLFGAYCASCHGPEGILGYPNPGTDDGSVPGLNPIDETIVNADAKKFFANVDLFVEHGSVPGGDSPLLIMPNFGDGKLLTPQQIADIIQYVILINTPK
jgi:mono/diheme cytochrome c family protein